MFVDNFLRVHSLPMTLKNIIIGIRGKNNMQGKIQLIRRNGTRQSKKREQILFPSFYLRMRSTKMSSSFSK
jgi:hypothetical protein